MVVVKDISRFARNTVDLLQSVRKLKALGIETQFLTANMTSMGNSEFVLTIFGALAQEESANTSKRIKFGKKVNAEKGRVPNIVYGYDKTIGGYCHSSCWGNQYSRIICSQIRICKMLLKYLVDQFGGLFSSGAMCHCDCFIFHYVFLLSVSFKFMVTIHEY